MNFTENFSNCSALNVSNDSVLDIHDYLLRRLGPKHLGYEWLLPLTVIYFIIFTTGLVGNGCTCIVIARNPYMHTATNCYLFNLAVADMLTLICAMPLEMYSLWHQYPWQLGLWACILRTVASEATAYASILTIVTFSCEQYGAVCRVLRPQVSARQKLTRACKFIILIWVVSIAAATPYGKFARVNFLSLNSSRIEESAWCGFPFNEPNRKWETLMLCSTFLFFVVPMTLITAIYVRISLVLYRARHLYQDNAGNCRNEANRRRIRSRRTVIRMLIAVVVGFFACWAPYHSQRLLFLYVSLYGKWTEPLRKINQDLFSVAGCFFYLNSTINPMLYSVMSTRFRVAFKENLCSADLSSIFPCCWETDNRGSHSYRSSSQQRPPMAEQRMLPMIVGNERVPEGKRFALEMSSSDDRRRNAVERPHFSSDPSISSRAVNSGGRNCIKSTSSSYELARDKFSGIELQTLQDGVQCKFFLAAELKLMGQYKEPPVHAASESKIKASLGAESKL